MFRQISRQLAKSAARTSRQISSNTLALAPVHLSRAAENSHFSRRLPSLSPFTRAFSASSDSGLLKTLEQEQNHEKEAYAQPQELQVEPPNMFSVDEKPGSADLILRRSFGGENIAIYASVDSLNEDAPEELPFEGQEEAEEEENDDLFPASPIPVRVSITKDVAGKPSTLELQCTVEGDSWLIERITAVGPEGEVEEDKDEALPYEGPDFSALDPALQQQFESYLSARGIGSDLARYVRTGLEDKEQREYMGWLKAVHEFVGAKK